MPAIPQVTWRDDDIAREVQAASQAKQVAITFTWASEDASHLYPEFFYTSYPPDSDRIAMCSKCQLALFVCFVFRITPWILFQKHTNTRKQKFVILSQPNMKELMLLLILKYCGYVNVLETVAPNVKDLKEQRETFHQTSTVYG